MYTIEEKTTLVGVSELRTKMKEIREALEHSKVVLENRNEPFAVLVNLDQYAKMEKILELVEDHTLGYIAKDRDALPTSKYLSLDEAERKLKLR